MKKLTVIMAVIGCVMAEMLAMNISAGAVSTQAIETTYEVGDTSHCEPWIYETQDPTGAWSEGGTFGVSGKLRWRINPETNEMIISGEGAMDDYYYGWYDIIGRPWEQWKSTIESIVIEEGITRIGKYAFSSFDKLQSVSIPDTVTTIGENAFSHCEKLEMIDIPSSVTTIESLAFRSCNLRTVSIPDGVTTIAGGTFMSNKNLTEIILPDSIESIESGAISGCTSLEKITFPKNLKEIGRDAFVNTAWYDKLERDENGIISSDGIIFNAHETAREKDGTGTRIFEAGTAKGDIVLPDDTKIIADEAFLNCSEMTSITIPNGVKSIGEFAFKGCSKLESITIPDTVTKIQLHTFSECSNLKTINLPDSITKIEDLAFALTPLEEMTLPQNVTSVGKRAFTGCKNLKSVTYPESVEEIGELQFGTSTNVQDITILNPHCRIGELCKSDSGTVNFSQTVTMHGYPYSTAQTFAEASGWNFVPIGAETAVSGDANGDNEFSLLDVVQVHKMLQTRKAPPKSCDMNKDNKVNVIDLSLMKQKLLSK